MSWPEEREEPGCRCRKGAIWPECPQHGTQEVREMSEVEYIRYEIPTGHEKRITLNERVIAVAKNGTEVDLSRLVRSTKRQVAYGELELLEVTFMGFEIVQNYDLNPKPGTAAS